MKALSIARPWTELILQGIKGIENRTWGTTHRGYLLVHAAQSWQGGAVTYAESQGVELSWDSSTYPTGIVGLVDVVDVCTARHDNPHATCECGPWAAAGQRHWRLANPRRLVEPVPCRGALGLWQPSADVLAAAMERILDA